MFGTVYVWLPQKESLEWLWTALKRPFHLLGNYSRLSSESRSPTAEKKRPAWRWIGEGLRRISPRVVLLPGKRLHRTAAQVVWIVIYFFVWSHTVLLCSLNSGTATWAYGYVPSENHRTSHPMHRLFIICYLYGKTGFFEMTIMLGKVEIIRKRGRQNMTWIHLLKEATALSFQELSKAVEDGTCCRSLIYKLTGQWKRA